MNYLKRTYIHYELSNTHLNTPKIAEHCKFYHSGNSPNEVSTDRKNDQGDGSECGHRTGSHKQNTPSGKKYPGGGKKVVKSGQIVVKSGKEVVKKVVKSGKIRAHPRLEIPGSRKASSSRL